MAITGTTVKRLTICVLTTGFIGVGQPASLLAQAPQAKEWTARYDSGTEDVKSATEMKITVSADAVVLRPHTGSEVTIAISSVKAVTYDTRVQRRTKQGAILMAASPLGGLLLARSKKTQHFITIESEKKAATRTVVMELGKDDYAEVLQALKDATGRDWTDLAQRRKATEDELRREMANAVDLRLDKAVVVNAVSLKPGRYQLILLERPGDTGELYFFPGKKVTPEGSAAHITVHVVKETSNVKTAEVAYRVSEGQASMSEIRMPAKTFRMVS